jgi:dihydroorotate dehydrogenase
MSVFIKISSQLYKHVAKPIFFTINPETFHNIATSFGETLGEVEFIRNFTKKLLGKRYPNLKQEISGIEFVSPMGLAAGYDYEAKAVNLLGPLGFGFNTVGTITNEPFDGNPKPRLGRLPKSKSIMVNKGFKNRGAVMTYKALKKKKTYIPMGVSIGQTNKEYDNLDQAIQDILQAFKIFETPGLKLSYYELNISCPNLHTNISFYKPTNLEKLLKEVKKLKIKKPIFIKMPINESNTNYLKMVDVIVRHGIEGVIVGNLQKDRTNSALVKSEIKWKVGNFSGLPTQARSNELIKLTYQKFGGKLIVIGCGGVFSTEDAYRKIRLGANLVQLITGLIYEGPTLVAQINKELSERIKQDGYKNIYEAVGVDNA